MNNNGKIGKQSGTDGRFESLNFFSLLAYYKDKFIRKASVIFKKVFIV